MPTYSLNNTSAEINCTISETYCRLTGNYAGPLSASLVSNSGFLIQNGNKQTGLFIGNSCFVFGSNILDFTKNCQSLTLRVPESCNFLISGQSSGQYFNFKSDGSLLIGYPLASNCLGLQINNYSPNLILTDINSSEQNQAISFRNDSGNIFSKFFNNPSASVNSTTAEATQISYNKALIFNEFGCSAKTFLSGNYLSFGFESCLNTGYNFSVNGSGYFSTNLYTPTLIANIGCFNGNKLYINGSGFSSSIEICNRNYFGTADINFYNYSGSLYNKISSCQNFTDGSSELNFYTTPTGLYGPFDRCELALKISGDKSATFYGNICSETGNFSYVKTNELNNLGSRSYLNTGINGQHCLMLNNSFIYSYCSISGFITDHVWYTSGNNTSMCLNRFGNLINIGSIFSHSGLCTTGSLCVNNNQLNSCIVSKCIILSGNGSLCNINLFGNVQTCGSFENNSSGQAKFFGICSTGIGDNIVSGNLLSCSRICSSGGVCSVGCIQSSSCGVFNQGVVSNSWICAQNSGVFGSVVCALGTANTNCFCSSINVCGSVNAINTAKAWGIYGLNNNNAPTLTGLNIKSINIYQNATPLIYAYGICFNNPITYPFVVNFNVYSSGNALITGNNFNLQNGESLGFSGVSSTSTHLGSSSATVAYPFSVQFYALSGKRSSDNTFAAYSAGTSYSEIYFNLANQDGPTTNYADLTRANAHGIIHFSIFGQ
jgi:hypothetical protein